MEEIKMLKLKELKKFKNHPFKVIRNAELDELMESIEKDGIIQLILSVYARWMDLLRRIHSYLVLLGKRRSAKAMSSLKS